MNIRKCNIWWWRIEKYWKELKCRHLKWILYAFTDSRNRYKMDKPQRHMWPTWNGAREKLSVTLERESTKNSNYCVENKQFNGFVRCLANKACDDIRIFLISGGLGGLERCWRKWTVCWDCLTQSRNPMGTHKFLKMFCGSYYQTKKTFNTKINLRVHCSDLSLTGFGFAYHTHLEKGFEMCPWKSVIRNYFSSTIGIVMWTSKQPVQEV